MGEDNEKVGSLEEGKPSHPVSSSSQPGLLEVVQSTQAAQTALYFLQYFKPSFMNRSATRQRLRSTSWLDGLRGFAAFLVYWQHHGLWAHEAHNAGERFQSAYGYKGEYWFIAFPIIRTLFTGGHLAVAIFLFVSGYALSWKPLQLLQNGELLAFNENIASALFRRWFRLWVPLFTVSLLVVLWYHVTGIFINYVPERGIRDELRKFYYEFKIYSFIYGQPRLPWLSYHPHTWTIPVEMKGSIIVYCALISFQKAQFGRRMLGYAALTFYTMYITDGAFFSMFTSGLAICDLENNLDKIPRWMKNLEPHKDKIFQAMLVVGLLIGGCPSHKQSLEYVAENPGWGFLSKFKPQAVWDPKWFYLFWSAMLIVLSVPRIPPIKRFFETPFCQYLGKISYMLYLVHGPVIWVLGDRVYAAVGWTRLGNALHLNGWVNIFPLPQWGPLGMEVNFFLPHLILLPVTFWLAELGTNMIDTPSVKFAQWLYTKMLPPRPAS